MRPYIVDIFNAYTAILYGLDIRSRETVYRTSAYTFHKKQNTLSSRPYTETVFFSRIHSIKEAFGNGGSNIFVQPTFAILDYKSYYDQFIDKHLVDKYSRMDFTQLYFKIQPSRVSDMEAGSKTPGSNLLVRTNYRKFGQEKILLQKEDFQLSCRISQFS